MKTGMDSQEVGMMIEVEGLVKTFKDVPAVNDVSFSVKEGKSLHF